MVGSAIVKRLQNRGDVSIITKSKSDLDLTDQSAVFDFFSSTKIDQVYLAAAKVGGIHANNNFPADFIYENLMIQCNVINSANKVNIDKLLYLGSSCIYPKFSRQPIAEAELLTGKLEETNEPYAVAKIAGIKLCESYNRQFGRDYRSIMPTNLYGANDNFHLDNSHVIPALIRKFHDAKVNDSPSVDVWGSGIPRREFLYVDDLASAAEFVMELPRDKYASKISPMATHINVGVGSDISIAELVSVLKNIIGYSGAVNWDRTKPDGTPRKLMDSSLLESMGWRSNVGLDEGLRETYEWFCKNYSEIRSS